jgi:hypothetical protein
MMANKSGQHTEATAAEAGALMVAGQARTEPCDNTATSNPGTQAAQPGSRRSFKVLGALPALGSFSRPVAFYGLLSISDAIRS